MAGLDCVSAWVISIVRPRMPPRALISATARSAPFLKFVPTVAPPPESSPTLAILIGPPVWANATPLRPAAMARAPAIFHAFISDVLPLAPARTVSGSLAAPCRRSLRVTASLPGPAKLAPRAAREQRKPPADENRVDPRGPGLGGPPQAREPRPAFRTLPRHSARPAAVSSSLGARLAMSGG